MKGSETYKSAGDQCDIRSTSQERTHLELPHDPLAASVTEILGNRVVVVVMRALIRCEEIPRGLQETRRDPPRTLGGQILREATPLGLRCPEGFGVDDGSRSCQSVALQERSHGWNIVTGRLAGSGGRDGCRKRAGATLLLPDTHR